jgi:hypothetical protein
MFQSSKKRLRAWLDVVDEMLVVVDEMLVGDAPAPVDAHAEPPGWATHPHRRPLRSQRARRAGSVPEAAAHCLCPVRRVRGEVGERPMRESGRQLTN